MKMNLNRYTNVTDIENYSVPVIKAMWEEYVKQVESNKGKDALHPDAKFKFKS